MPRIRFPHSVIVKSPGLLPMHYKVSELATAIDIPERTLRDWLVAGAPHFRDQRDNLWIHGRDFGDWITSLRKPVKEQKLGDGEAFCMRCNQPVGMTDISTQAMQGKLILIRGKCPHCGCKINRGGCVPTYSANNLIWKDTRNEN
jgi:hypothetical protein